MATGITDYEIEVGGTSPIIHHSGIAGLATAAESPIKREIAALAAVTQSKRTDEQETELRRLEGLNSLWLDEHDRVCVPEGAVRACIEAAARKTKDGPAVREGLTVTSTSFWWDPSYGSDESAEERRALADRVGFSVPVVLNQKRVNRTRAKFDVWRLTFRIEADDEIVQSEKLRRWIEVGGRRVGLGDWRPQKSGSYGRFDIRRFDRGVLDLAAVDGRP